MSGRSRLLSIGLPVAGLCALAGGIYLVAANRPPVMSESAPRRPVTQPRAETLAATGVEAGGLIGAVGTSEPPLLRSARVMFGPLPQRPPPESRMLSSPSTPQTNFIHSPPGSHS